jgi:hypothetical protein
MARLHREPETFEILEPTRRATLPPLAAARRPTHGCSGRATSGAPLNGSVRRRGERGYLEPDTVARRTLADAKAGEDFPTVSRVGHVLSWFLWLGVPIVLIVAGVAFVLTGWPVAVLGIFLPAAVGMLAVVGDQTEATVERLRLRQRAPCLRRACRVSPRAPAFE